jgi:hypothetical protein
MQEFQSHWTALPTHRLPDSIYRKRKTLDCLMTLSQLPRIYSYSFGRQYDSEPWIGKDAKEDVRQLL